MSETLFQLSDGIEGLFVKNTRFHTTLISFNFYLPLNRKTVASYGLLPFILTSCSKDYPSFSALNRKLARLYGAKLDASTEKYGDYQLLKMSVSVINDSHSLDDESLCLRASELLLGLIFDPNVENGSFSEKDIAREKRKAIEHIKGDINDKRIYAKNRLIEEMFSDSAYGTPKCGTVEDVEKITGESLYKSWQQLLATAFIRIHVVGASVPAGLFEAVSERFSVINRHDITDCRNSSPIKSINAPKETVERMDISQGKLCMGFSSELYGNDEVSLPLMIMSDIFGGGAYSRLFTNVREKMSLCYYCSSSSTRTKGFLTVSSGVEAENCEKAQKEILNQLEIMKKGEFTDFEFESSLKSITDSLNSYYDSLETIDMWYTLKINNPELYSPENIAEKISHITREDIINTAKGIKLHTVYKLLPKEVKE